LTGRADWLPFAAASTIALVCALAPVLPLSDPLKMQMAARFAGASVHHLLGQDEFGRDVLSRLIWGTQSSLLVAVSSGLLAGAIGTSLGILAGYMRGLPEVLTMRSMDVLLCFPALVLALLFVTLYGPGVATLVPILAIVFVPGFTRVAYSSVLTVRSQEYVEAAKALGASDFRIMSRTILPNIGGPLLVQLSFAIAAAVVLESGLSFLGLGVVPPSPSLGSMIGSARSTMGHAAHLLLWPCLTLTVLVLTLNGVCDALRDLLDPRPAGAGSGLD